jgi:hypothetical protein
MPVDTRQFDALVARFRAAGKDARKELGRALVSSQRAAKTEFTRATRLIYNVKVSSFQSNLRVGEANAARLNYKVEATNKGIPVTSFSARQTRQGLTFQTRKDGGRKLITSGFAPKVGRFLGVPFKRDGAARLPISVVYGPSAADMIAAASVQAPALEKTKERLNVDIERRINRITRG